MDTAVLALAILAGGCAGFIAFIVFLVMRENDQ
jgi:hypothetical protein